MMDGVEGTLLREGDGLAERQTDQQRSTRPGPRVAATTSTSASVTPARSSASRLTAGQFGQVLAGGDLGHHAAVGDGAASWLETTDDSTRPAPSTTAQAVSSQEVSMPRTRGEVMGGV